MGGRDFSEERCERVLAFLHSRPDDPPTIREIMAACDISSTSVASYMLDQLVAEGKITRKGLKSRSIRLAGQPAAKAVVDETARLRGEVVRLTAEVVKLRRELGLREAAR